MFANFHGSVKHHYTTTKRIGRLSFKKGVSSLLIAGIICFYCDRIAFAQFGLGDLGLRTTPSTAEHLLVEIYNNAVAGNDRLADIEKYMSRGLRISYNKAVKQVKKGKVCDVPRILSNRYFSGKLRGFKVKPIKADGKNIEAVVIIDTGSQNLSQNSEFKRFDPSVYEKITFKLTKLFREWKIDDISTSEPNLDEKKDGQPTYKTIDLREVLKQCN